MLSERARGRFRSGSETSPATKLMNVQPLYAIRQAIIAKPNWSSVSEGCTAGWIGVLIVRLSKLAPIRRTKPAILEVVQIRCTQVPSLMPTQFTADSRAIKVTERIFDV